MISTPEKNRKQLKLSEKQFSLLKLPKIKQGNRKIKDINSEEGMKKTPNRKKTFFKSWG